MKTAFYSFFFFQLLIGQFLTFEPIPKSKPGEDFSQYFDSVITDEMINQQILGCAVGIIQNGQVVHVNAYGHHDLLRKNPVTLNSVFRWASVSKVITAVCAHKAIEENNMRLSDRATQFVPSWPRTGNKDRITMEHLITHHSGILHYRFENNGKICNYQSSRYNVKNNFDAAKCVSTFKDCPLAFIPGTRYLYTSFGYNLLGAAIEGATGVKYVDYVKNKISDKLGLVSLSPYAADPGGAEMTCEGWLKVAAVGNVEWRLPGGGWSSDITDMTRFLYGLVNGYLLNNTETLWTDNMGNIRFNGLNVDTQDPGGLFVSHGGSHNDIKSFLGFYPGIKSGFVFLINGGDYINTDRFINKIKAFSLNQRPAASKAFYSCADNVNCGSRTAGIWRKTEEPTNDIIRIGLNKDRFITESKMLNDMGYYATDIETIDKGRAWNVIYKKTGTPTQVFIDLDNNTFHNKYAEMKGRRYHLVDIETYGNPRKWAGIFMVGSGNNSFLRGLTSNEMANKIIEQRDRGMRLIDFETYDGKWAGIWVTGAATYTSRGLSTTELERKKAELFAQGYNILDLEAYLQNASRRWAVIWEKDGIDKMDKYDLRYCDWLTNHHKVNVSNGYELIDFEMYQ